MRMRTGRRERERGERVREEYAVVLDFLPYGYSFDRRPGYLKTPVAQVLGKESLVLLEVAPRKDCVLQPYEEVYIGEGKRDKVHHIIGRVSYSKLTQTASTVLETVLEKIVKENEKRFIEFFNTCTALNMRIHKLELLPGIGKKHMKVILEEREKKLFENYKDLAERVKLLPEIEKMLVKRIVMELSGTEKHCLFVRW